MIIINLKKYYPELYSSDYEIAVTDEVAAALNEFQLRDAAYRLRTYRHKAYFSLDCGDQIEREALMLGSTPHEILEHRLTMEQLHAAIINLPDKQRKRVYAHFIMGMSKAAIARTEGVNESNVRKSINRALQNMADYLKNSL